MSEEIAASVEELRSNTGADVEMAEGGEAEGSTAGNEGGDLPFAEGGDVAPRISYVTYLTSPIVTLVVGSGESETILTAHQALLAQSPFFADACAAFTDDGSVRSAKFSIRCPLLLYDGKPLTLVHVATTNRPII